MKEIGRKGWEHIAEIIIEWVRCLDQAGMTKAMWQTLETDPGIDQLDFMENWLAEQAV